MEPSLKSWVAEVASAERAAMPELDFEAQRERFLRHAENRRRRGRAKRWWVFAAVAATAVISALTFSMPDPALRFDADGQRASAGDRLTAPEHAPLPLEFSDGSLLTLAAAGRVRVLEVDAKGASLQLERGQLRAKVVHADRTRWQFAAGPFRVEVVGTRFELGWEPSAQSFRLSLQEGAVRVTGPNLHDGCLFSAGDEVDMSLGTGAARGRCVIAEQQPAANGTGPPPSQIAVAPPETPATRKVAVPDWRELAGRADYMGAWAAIEQRGFDAVRAHSSAADLMTLADLARFARQPDKAVGALTQLRERFPDTTQASHAAFLLGRVASDQLGAPERAARWFATYLSERPNGDFASEALGRLIDCHDRAGDPSAARETAARYLELYPMGAYAATARHVLERQQ